MVVVLDWTTIAIGLIALTIVLVVLDVLKIERQNDDIGGALPWAIGLILMWIFVFPYYIVKRNKLKEDATQVFLSTEVAWLTYIITLGVLSLSLFSSGYLGGSLLGVRKSPEAEQYAAEMDRLIKEGDSAGREAETAAREAETAAREADAAAREADAAAREADAAAREAEATAQAPSEQESPYANPQTEQERQAAIDAYTRELQGQQTAVSSGQEPPTFSRGDDYGVVRQMMIDAGWSPHLVDNADACDGDPRCDGRPEMEACSGSGVASCKFNWERNGTVVSICTYGEEQAKFGQFCE